MKHLRALNKYFVKYKWRLAGGIFFVIISNIPAVLLPQVIRYVIDLVEGNIGLYRILDGSASQHPLLDFLIGAIAFCGAVMILLALLRGFFMFCMRQTLVVMSRYIEFDLKNEIYNHYQALDLNFFKTHNTGDLMSRITEDVARVRMFVGPALMYTTNLIVTILMTIFAMLRVNTELTLYTLSPLPILAAAIYYVNLVIHKKSERIQAQLSTLTTLSQEAYSGIRVIKSYVQEESSRHFFDQASQQYRESTVNLARTEAVYFPSMSLIVGLSTLITIFIGGWEAIRGEVTLGSIAEFVVYVNLLTWPVAAIGSVAAMVQRASASQKRINEFLDTVPAVQNPPKALSRVLSGRISIRNLGFTYPHTGIRALNRFSLEVAPGEKVAIIGRTGSGKSTLSQLMIRLYDPQEGQILVDQTDIRDMDLGSLRSQVSYVPQDVFLFSDTLANNIRFGSSGAGMDRVEAAARAASVEQEVLGFPEGYQTVIGERGVTLSGGQKQRIAIARALIKDAPVLIFDDCLSAVDARTEKEILGNLYAFLKKKTALIITHRIFTLFSFDKILVLEEGSILEQGSHEDLLSRNGYYADLYAKQQLQDREQAGSLN